MKTTTEATAIKNEERALLKAMLPEVTKLLEQAKQVQTGQDKLSESYEDFVSALNTNEIGDFELIVDEEDYIFKVQDKEKVKGMTLIQLIASLSGTAEATQEENLFELNKALLEEGTTSTDLKDGQVNVLHGLIKIVEEQGKHTFKHDHLVARYRGVTVRDYKTIQIVEIFGALTFIVTNEGTEFDMVNGLESDFKNWFNNN